MVHRASTLLSMEVNSGSEQRDKIELLYPMMESSSGMEIPMVLAYLTAPAARESSEVITASNSSPSFRRERNSSRAAVISFAHWRIYSGLSEIPASARAFLKPYSLLIPL